MKVNKLIYIKQLNQKKHKKNQNIKKKNENQLETQKIFEMATQLLYNQLFYDVTNEGKHEDALKFLLNQIEAIECYDKAIQLNPKNNSAYNNKGQSFILLIAMALIQEYAFYVYINCNNIKWLQTFMIKLLASIKKQLILQIKLLTKLPYLISLNFQQMIDQYTFINFGKNIEAKQCYLNAVNAQFANKDYIQKQLFKL
ncbi:unnamed protein product [Paramecium pentaurelia]|uniref:Tetratricopeptide repeat protein n=1 Tax=Paramecium pentaurelia TaxID=43138 RepID=A0A8S1U151_9CILI|nr:unnamed protein product [Paramecium pentaurelia]